MQRAHPVVLVVLEAKRGPVAVAGLDKVARLVVSEEHQRQLAALVGVFVQVESGHPPGVVGRDAGPHAARINDPLEPACDRPLQLDRVLVLPQGDELGRTRGGKLEHPGGTIGLLDLEEAGSQPAE